ncbi:hypothetical protein QLX08_003043 [Tetragonisca angustula]|uniref:Uncharacterized protein n=1 Tax=Tetragonisca angustula TaxID=166442 RepID=A0AAW1AAR5_9HYME
MDREKDVRIRELVTIAVIGPVTNHLEVVEPASDKPKVVGFIADKPVGCRTCLSKSREIYYEFTTNYPEIVVIKECAILTILFLVFLINKTDRKHAIGP